MAIWSPGFALAFKRRRYQAHPEYPECPLAVEPGVYPELGSVAFVPSARSTVSQFESSKSGWAHRGFPVFASMGESPTVNFHGPYSGTTDWPRVISTAPGSEGGSALSGATENRKRPMRTRQIVLTMNFPRTSTCLALRSGEHISSSPVSGLV